MAAPTGIEWFVTSAAVAAVVGVGAAAVVGSSLSRAATTACKVVAVGLASLAVGSLLLAAVFVAAGAEASDIDLAAEEPARPEGPFVDHVIDADPDATEAAAAFAPLVLGPLAALLGVLAHAAVDPARTPGLRSVIGAMLGAVVLGAGLVVWGDTGSLATAAASAALALAVVAIVALVYDELALRRELHRSSAGSIS